MHAFSCQPVKILYQEYIDNSCNASFMAKGLAPDYLCPYILLKKYSSWNGITENTGNGKEETHPVS